MRRLDLVRQVQKQLAEAWPDAVVTVMGREPSDYAVRLHFVSPPDWANNAPPREVSGVNVHTIVRSLKPFPAQPKVAKNEVLIEVYDRPDQEGKQCFTVHWYDPVFHEGPQQRAQVFRANLEEYKARVRARKKRVRVVFKY